MKTSLKVSASFLLGYSYVATADGGLIGLSFIIIKSKDAKTVSQIFCTSISVLVSVIKVSGSAKIKPDMTNDAIVPIGIASPHN